MTPSPKTPETANSSPWRASPAETLGGVACAVVLLLAYGWPLATLVRRWWDEPDYIHGFLVIPFAVYLLLRRRAMIKGAASQRSAVALALGVVLLGVAGFVKWWSAFYCYALADPASLLPCLAGVVLLVGGWRALRWAWPSIAFLIFMIPLPGFLAEQLSQPLQGLATTASAYVIQTMGIPAMAQGNVILLTQGSVEVVQACSGLRMLMLFFAVCFGAAFVVRRSWAEKVAIVLSAVPIAILANVARITVTSICHEMASREILPGVVGHGMANEFYHNLAGWFMMPLAVVLLWVELWLLDKLLVEAIQRRPVWLAVSSADDRPGNRRRARVRRG